MHWRDLGSATQAQMERRGDMDIISVWINTRAQATHKTNDTHTHTHITHYASHAVCVCDGLITANTESQMSRKIEDDKNKESWVVF